MNVASLLSGDAPRRPPTSTSNTHPQQQQQQEQSQPPPHHHLHAPSQSDRQSSYHHPPPPPLHPGPGRDGPYHNGLPPLQPSPFENQQQQQQQAPPAGYHPYSQRRPSLSYDPRQQQQAPPPPPTAGQYQNSQNPPNQGGYATPPTMREYAMGNGGGQASQFGHPHLPPAMSNGNNGSNTKLPAMVGPGRHLPPPHAQTQPTNFIPHPASPHAQGHPGYNPNGAPPPPPPHQATAHLQSQSQSQSQPQSQPQLPPLPAPYPSHGRGPLMQVVTPQHRLPPNAKSPSRPTNGAATTPNGNGNNSNSSEPGRPRGVGHQHRRSIETKVAASSGAAPFSPLNPGGGDRHAPTLVLPSPNARTTKRTMDDREKEDQMARERSNRPTDNAGGNPTMPALPMPVTYAGNGNGNSKGPDSRSRPTSAFGHRTKGSNGSNGTAPPTGSTGPFGPPPPSNGDDARRPGTAGGSAHHSQHRLSTIPPPLSPSMSAPAPAPPTAPVAPPAPSYGPPPSQQSQPHYANGPQPQQPSHSPNNGYGQQQLQPGPPPSSQHRHHHHHHVVHAHPQQQGPPPPPPQQHHHHQTKYEMDNRMYGADLRDPRQQQAPVGYPPQPMVNGPPPPHLTQPHHHPGNGYGPPPPQHPQMMDPYQHQQQPPPPHHHHVQQHQQQPPPPHYTHAPPPPPPQHQQHYAPPPPPHHVQHLQPQHHHTAPPPPPPPHHQPPPLESTLVEPPHHHHHVHHVHHVHHHDSDLRLVVLHSGFVTLEDMSAAKLSGRDLRVTLRVGRYPRGRYIGGPVEKAAERSKIASSPSRSRTSSAAGISPGGVELRSYAWGNSHDGGSLEVVKCEWVKRGTAHSLHVPNRKARMAQYARQRARLSMAPPPQPTSASPVLPLPSPSASRKSSAGLNMNEARQARLMLSPVVATRRQGGLLTSSPFSEADTLVTSSSSRGGGDVALVSVDDEDDDTRRESEECGRWSVIVGFGGVATVGGKKTRDTLFHDAPGFLYDPQALKEAMFGELDTEEGPIRKKHKVSEDAVGKRIMTTGLALILENEDETYSLMPQAPSVSGNADASSTLRPPIAYAIYVQSTTHKRTAKSKQKKATEPSPRRLLASGLREADVQFDKTGICVWLDDAAKSDMVETVDGETAKRTGWFCHVRKWRYVEM
ncbi:hypothetical protein FRB94_012041 [Tulasnella sp. JGI-2019a]|nr:hypothetical protein FRB94_012041 [Tulasnella sp. JGI-2019a]